MEQYELPKCKGYTEVWYLGSYIYSAHWQQLCDADDKAKKKLLKKIDLVRDESGAVVPITTTEKD